MSDKPTADLVCFLCRRLCTRDEIAGHTRGQSSILWFCYACFHPDPDNGHDVTAKEAL